LYRQREPAAAALGRGVLSDEFRARCKTPSFFARAYRDAENSLGTRWYIEPQRAMQSQGMWS
jgi:hypothetical protein